jgi:hypothetical protein
MLRFPLLLPLAAVLLLPAGPAAAQTLPPAPKISPQAQPRLIVDGFAFAGRLQDLNPAAISEIAVPKGVESVAEAQREYGPADGGFVFVATSLPLHFGSQVLRTAAEKRAAVEVTPYPARKIRLHTRRELQLYGKDSTVQELTLGWLSAPPAAAWPSHKNAYGRSIPDPVGLVVIDGFRLPPTDVLPSLYPADLLQVELLRPAAATAVYGPAGSSGAFELYTKMPLLVRGQLLRTAAEKDAALRSTPSLRVRAWRLLTAEELARYGLAPDSVAFALTLEGKTLTKPPVLPGRG